MAKAASGAGPEVKAERVRSSAAFGRAKNRAETYAKDPAKLNGLVSEATRKAKGRKRSIGVWWGLLMATLRLIRAYAKGSYRGIPWRSLLMLVAAVLYFVMPFDLIPDFILGFGMLDDIALLGWVLHTFSSDIERFQKWEAENKDGGPPPGASSA